MKIIVVGGGIAGLTTGIALRRAGHKVHLYERSAFTDETGAALSISSNASRALIAWGLDPVRGEFVAARKLAWSQGDTLQETQKAQSTEMLTQIVGVPMYFAYRSDVHDELKRLATEDGEGTPVQVHLQSKVVHYDPDTPSITTADGSAVQGDLVVAADGVNSAAVEVVLGEPRPASPRGFHSFTYRCLISRADIEADPDTRFFNEDAEGRAMVYSDVSTRLLVYPCKNNQMYNLGLYFHHDDPSSVKPEDWRGPADKQQFIEKAATYNPGLISVLKKAKDVRLWPLLCRDPIPTYKRGKLVLVGDAAHPMLPHVGQGGAMGIEDAAALGVVLAGANPSEIPQRLEVWEKIRLNRSSGIQYFANVGNDKEDAGHAGVAKYIPVDKIPKNPEEFFQFVLGYDVFRDSVLQMKEIIPDFALPDKFFESEPARGPYVYP